jgi:hypothetical protein
LYAAIGVPPNFISGYSFERIDSLLRAQWYSPGSPDSCGGPPGGGISIYRLFEADSSIWSDCLNWNGFLGSALIRYAGIRFRSIFGQARETMIFEHGYIRPETGDTVFATQDWLVRGIGLYYRQYWWSGGWETLTGAVINGDTLGVIVSVAEPHDLLPVKVVLHQNYPNPFNSSTHIRYEVATREFVSLKVYNPLGQEVIQLVDAFQEPGLYRVAFVAEDLASGVYFYRLRVGENTLMRSMILLR